MCTSRALAVRAASAARRVPPTLTASYSCQLARCGRRAPHGGVLHVARYRLRAELLDHRAARGAHQRPHRLATGAERLDHVTADEAAPACDQHRHAGPTNGVTKGRSTTRASRPAARTI